MGPTGPVPVRALVLVAVLLAELAVAATLLAAPAPRTPVVTTLTVGDNRSVRLVDMRGPHTQRTVARIAAELDAAVLAVVDFWGAQWQRDITIDVTATQEQFDAALPDAAKASFGDVAAVAVADWADPARGIADGQRIVFAPGADRMSASALRLVLRHELFHFAARAQTALDAPVWITEGVADFVARPAAAPDVRVAAGLPTDAGLVGPEPGRTQAYDKAWRFTRFVADTYGAAALRQFYLRTAGTGHTDVTSAAREVFETDAQELLARFHAWQQAAV